MTMMDWIVKIHLCAIAAMIVMGAGGLVRNAYRWLMGRRNVAASETSTGAGDDAASIDMPVAALAPTETLRQRLFDSVADQAQDLLYYDRKEDDELPRGAIEQLVASGAVTVDEIVAAFESALRQGLPDEKA